MWMWFGVAVKESKLEPHYNPLMLSVSRLAYRGYHLF